MFNVLSWSDMCGVVITLQEGWGSRREAKTKNGIVEKALLKTGTFSHTHAYNIKNGIPYKVFAVALLWLRLKHILTYTLVKISRSPLLTTEILVLAESWKTFQKILVGVLLCVIDFFLQISSTNMLIQVCKEFVFMKPKGNLFPSSPSFSKAIQPHL